MTPKDKAKVQQALAALELNNDEWKSLADSGDCGYWKAEDQDHYKQTSEAITALRQLLEQPADHSEQDLDMVENGDLLTIVYMDGLHTGKRMAKREWVGLTADEMLEALIAVDPATKRLPIGFARFAQAVEAKLKEKNT